MNSFLRSLVIVAIGVAVAVAAEPAGTPLVRYGDAVKCGPLQNPELIESSGIVLGRRNPKVLWSHNDSGDTARFFALNEKGEDLGTWEIPGLRPHDWEDIAAVKIDGVDHLVLCDTGDNHRKRDSHMLYFAPEPEVDVAKRAQHGTLKPTLTMQFKYPDGAHDCEAVFVDPIDQTIVLITKEYLGECGVYTLPLSKEPGVKTATRIAKLGIVTVTGADVSPDGRKAILVTYGSAFEFHRAEGQTWAQAFAERPRVLVMPARKQGEGICYGADGVTLYLTSEGKGEPLWKIAPK